MSFEDLDVWKRAVRLSCETYKQTCGLKDFGFRDQLTRSALSIPSNIAEGFERKTSRETAQFLNIAKGSAGEFRTQVHIGMEVGFIALETGEIWIDEARQIGNILGALIRKHRNE